MMGNWLSIGLVAVLGLVMLACGGSGSDPGTRSNGGSGGSGSGGSGGVTLTCATLQSPPASCGEACSSDSQCEGAFCSSGSCVANCTDAEGCSGNEVCNVRGRCVPVFGSGGTGGAGATGGGNGCQSVEVTPTRSIPNVMFLVDQSASMDADFGGGENRWEAAHSAINAIVSDPLDDIVRFGLTTYTSRNGFQDGRDCPRLPTQIGFALDNSTAFADDSVYPYTYSSADGEDTPTGDSIDALVSQIQASPPPNEGPTIIVLATDGLPDSCECADNFPNPIDTSQRYCQEFPPPTDPRIEAVDAVTAAHAQGIDVFALWVGDLSDDPADSTRRHMQDVADAGVEGAGTVYVGDDPANLSQAFTDIVTDSISCDVTMEERFVDAGKACEEGDVRLDGTPLPCVASCDGDGWCVKPDNDQVIQLVGSACDTLKTGDVTFSAEFPCGSIVVE